MNRATKTGARGWRDESGQVVILLALSLTVLLGFVGLATDVGVLIHDKRNLQIAADAAAIAGAKQIQINNSGNVVAAGKSASAANGFTDGQNGVTVAVNAPPVNGPNAGHAGFVEAIVQYSQPTFFMRALGINSSLIGARAVAFDGANSGTGCLTALNPTAGDTIHLQGSFNLDAPGCAVIDNSSAQGSKNNSALYFNGAGGTLAAGSVGVVGTADGQTSDSSPAPVTGISGVSDPLAPLISPPSYDPASCTAPPTSTTWGPAKAGGTVCYSGTIKTTQNITLDPGVYVLTGTLDLGGGGTLNGTGVTFYLAGPNGTWGKPGSGNTTLNLTAPTSGPYNGILLYEDPSDTNTITLIGNPVANWTGIIYAPNAELDLGGTTNMTLVTDLIVGKLYDFGSATITINDYTRTVSNSPLNTIALVE